MMQRPVFSMPSIVDKLKSIKPDVPDPMMADADNDPGRKYLLKQASVLDQQNVIMGGALDVLIEQARVTNGRINVMEPKVEKHERAWQATEDQSKQGRWKMEIVWVPVGLVLLQVIAHKIGWL